MKSRSVRTLAVLASAGLIVGAFAAGPADAAKKKKKKKKKPPACAAFTPGIEGAADAEVVQITPAATEEKPLVIDYEHGAAGPSAPGAGPFPGHPGLTETKYFNVQVNSGQPSSGLYVKQEFSERHDLDLYLYNAAGEEVTHSGAFNPAPVDAVVLDFSSGGNGGTNFESISGVPVAQCEGLTIESIAYVTPGTDVKLSIWFGEIVEAEE